MLSTLGSDPSVSHTHRSCAVHHTLQPGLPGSVFLARINICNIFWHKLLAIVADGRIHSNSQVAGTPPVRRASPTGGSRVRDRMSSHAATGCCELFSNCSPCLPRTLALRRHKRRLATPPSRNGGLVLPSVRSTSSARRFTVPRTESSVASEDTRSKPLRLISMCCRRLLGIFLSERLASEGATASPAKVSEGKVVRPVISSCRSNRQHNVDTSKSFSAPENHHVRQILVKDAL